jgi:hypothetical protein
LKHHGNIPFVDVTFEKYEDYAKAKSLLNIMAEYFKVLGEYKNTKYKDPQVTKLQI